MLTPSDDIVRSLCTDVLEVEAAPELPLLDMYLEADDTRRNTSKGPLGFGVEVGAAASLILPLVVDFFYDLIVELRKETIDGLAKETSEVLTEKFRHLLKIAPSEEDKSDVEAVTAAKLVKAGMGSEKARSTAKAIVKSVLNHKDKIRNRER